MALGPLTRENVSGWIKIILAILMIRWVWFEPFSVPSGSMEPTFRGDGRFLHDDRVAVNKFRYGIRVPFRNKHLIRFSDPQRWDIAVFNNPVPNAEHAVLVKRIVGLPGERVHIQDGKVYINDEALELPAGMPDVQYTSPGPNPEDLRRVLDRFPPERRASAKLRIREQFVRASGSPLRYGILPDDEFSLIPPDHYLMLGDNSAHSGDGRIFGWTPRDNLIGPVFCIWWPMAHARDFSGFTRTWWGRLLLYGIPALFLAYELIGAFLLRSWRIHRVTGTDTFKKGDHVLVDRLSFGLRLPFMGRLIRGRAPHRGEWVFYLGPAEDGKAPPLRVGRVTGLPGETVVPPPQEGASPVPVPVGHYYIAAEDDHDHSDEVNPAWVPHHNLVGRVVAVWRPLRRFRAFRSAAGG